jgi:hypothetical protein
VADTEKDIEDPATLRVVEPEAGVIEFITGETPMRGAALTGIIPTLGATTAKTNVAREKRT